MGEQSEMLFRQLVLGYLFFAKFIMFETFPTMVLYRGFYLNIHCIFYRAFVLLKNKMKLQYFSLVCKKVLPKLA